MRMQSPVQSLLGHCLKLTSTAACQTAIAVRMAVWLHMLVDPGQVPCSITLAHVPAVVPQGLIAVSGQPQVQILGPGAGQLQGLLLMQGHPPVVVSNMYGIIVGFPGGHSLRRYVARS